MLNSTLSVKSIVLVALFSIFVLHKCESAIEFFNSFNYYVDLSERLCDRDIVTEQDGDCPRRPWVTAPLTNNRLGNKLESYTYLWLLARENPEIEVLVSPCLARDILTVCEKLSIPILKNLSCGSKWPVQITPRWSTDGETVARHFQPLRHELRIALCLRRYAQATLAAEELKMAAGGNKARQQTWWVSIHVRRKDYITHHLQGKQQFETWNVTIPPPVRWYVRAARSHLRRAPSRPRALILLSDDTPWLQEVLAPALRRKLKNSTHIAVLDTNATEALALQAAANSSVVDYGTFGMFGAILAGGYTTIYPLPPGLSSTVDLIGYLPHWRVQF